MDQPLATFYKCIIAALFFIISSLHFTHADELNITSVANLSSSWTIKPTNLIDVQSTSLPWKWNSLTPILLSKPNYTNFVCGFICYNETENCLLGVILYLPARNSLDYVIVKEPQLVWSANRDHPIKINATLNFMKDGDLVLKDADESLVWSTSTRDKNISRLELTKIGNLMLYNKADKIVWQSFDHPTDSLLPGQNLSNGQKLISSISASNWSTGQFSLSIQDDILSMSYMKSNPPQKYYQTDYLNDTGIRFRGRTFEINLDPLYTIGQYLRLESDGHMKIYQWTSSYGDLSGRDIFTLSSGECGYPLVCGKYGMCLNGQCSCPEEAENETSSFRQIRYRQPTLGCAPITPISCKNSHLHTLLELKNTTYFNLNRDIYSWTKISEVDERLNLEDCKHKCLRNCSCRAAVYAFALAFSGQRGCLLVTEIFSLINNEEGSDRVSVFLKVEKPQSITNSSTKKKLRRRQFILGYSLAGSFIALFLFGLCLFLVMRNKETEEIEEFDVDQVSGMPSRFSFEKLRTITRDFSTKLGQGGFGSVYEGTLDDGTRVAVKRLDGLGHIKKSFLAEVETIGSIHHVNLVSLIGFCAEKSHRLLVYEYMPNGSMDKWIFQKNEEPTLGWQSRKKIISDIAKGLAYLHEDCKMKILLGDFHIFHLDIKPQNILIDGDFSAKVSDFGLAKLIGKDQSRVMTTLRGTPGYLAPEWLSSIITEKVDVYSFGVVVLEILCGRRNIDHSQPEVEMHLLALFKTKAEQNRLEDIIDKHNEDVKFNAVEVTEMMKVAAWCLQCDYTKRPSMSVVVKVLEGSADVVDNLDYNFTNLVISKTSSAPVGHLQNMIRDATPLLPVTLSGPR